MFLEPYVAMVFSVTSSPASLSFRCHSPPRILAAPSGSSIFFSPFRPFSRSFFLTSSPLCSSPSRLRSPLLTVFWSLALSFFHFPLIFLYVACFFFLTCSLHPLLSALLSHYLSPLSLTFCLSSSALLVSFSSLVRYIRPSLFYYPVLILLSTHCSLC